jgi:hypothetical protein
MADPIAIISLVATPTIVAAYSIAQSRYELQRTDMRELRAVLDASADSFLATLSVCEEYDELWYSGAPADGHEARRLHARNDELLAQTRTARDRIAIRVGRQDKVCVLLGEALRALDDFFEFITEAHGNGSAHDQSRAVQLRRDAIAARERFLDAAAMMAGTQLKPFRRRSHCRPATPAEPRSHGVPGASGSGGGPPDGPT